MPSRRQEKMARVIKEAVSDVIREHLSDPRIQGIVSVTEVDVPPDLKSADVYFSVAGVDEKKQDVTLQAIFHAGKRIQAFVGREITAKYTPTLRLHKDEKFKKTLEMLRLIDQVNRQEDEDFNEKS